MTPPCRALRAPVLYECSCCFPARIGDVVYHQPRATRQRRRGHSGEPQDLSMKVGLVGVTTLRGDPGRAFTRGQPVSGVVEADQLRGTLWRQTDLRTEPRPQPFAAPSEL